MKTPPINQEQNLDLRVKVKRARVSFCLFVCFFFFILYWSYLHFQIRVAMENLLWNIYQNQMEKMGLPLFRDGDWMCVFVDS